MVERDLDLAIYAPLDEDGSKSFWLRPTQDDVFIHFLYLMLVESCTWHQS